MIYVLCYLIEYKFGRVKTPLMEVRENVVSHPVYRISMIPHAQRVDFFLFPSMNPQLNPNCIYA